MITIRIEFCDWTINEIRNNPLFSRSILFNAQNLHYCSDSNPRWFTDSKMQGTRKVWWSTWDEHIIALFFHDGKLNSFGYLYILQELIMPNILKEEVPIGWSPSILKSVSDLANSFPILGMDNEMLWSGKLDLQTLLPKSFWNTP